MNLYHAGKLVIREPELSRGRKNADFGQGFYLTPDRDFTFRWAGRDAVINRYELDTDGMSVRRFERDADWFDYIIRNRRMQDSLSVDVVIGPIANDTLFDTFGIMSSGFLTTEQALKLLEIGPEYTQVAVKTERALRQLRWLGVEDVGQIDADMLAREREEYSLAFGTVLHELLGED